MKRKQSTKEFEEAEEQKIEKVHKPNFVVTIMPEIDDYVLGSDAMQKMNSTNIFIFGLDGLGLEVGGVKSVTLYDKRDCQISDLSTHYYLSEEDVGKNIAEASQLHLGRLNEYVKIKTATGTLTRDVFDGIHVVVIANKSYNEIFSVYELTQGMGIKFIISNVYGLVGSIFCDFGADFYILDKNGEALVESVEGIVTCIEDKRHGLEDGDFIKFSEVENMAGIEDLPPRPVKVITPSSFSVGDLSMFSDFGRGGIATQVKMPSKMSFKTFKESLLSPTYVISDFEKMDRPNFYHLCFYTLQLFVERHGRMPRPHDVADSDSFMEIVKSINGQFVPKVDELDENFVRRFSYQCSGCICPMFSFFGGFVAQEVFKAATGKFTPIFQNYYFDSFEVLPDNYLEMPPSEFQPLNSRYDAQIAIFGRKFQDCLSKLSLFIVGSGAIGCEHLKNISMIGAGHLPYGSVCITDMDTVERSNLNRQFLFRSSDIGKFKSESACNAVRSLNPLINFVSHVHRMGPETEKIFDDPFFEKIDIVLNALDNVEARTYMDRKCLFYHKPLLESGTLGPKGNVQVVIPHMTESYSSSYDPPEKSIPMCTLKNFPYLPEHAIQWARDLFEGLFTNWPTLLKNFIENPNTLLKEGGVIDTDKMKALTSAISVEETFTFKDCVKWAKNLARIHFRDEIEQLIYSFPKDKLTQHGVLFWSGTKRFPSPVSLEDPPQEIYEKFIVSCSKLRAFNFGISCDLSNQEIMEIEKSIKIEKFTPKTDFFVATTDSEVKNQDTIRDESNLPTVTDYETFHTKAKNFINNNNLTINEIHFEKDVDSNHHIDFVYSVSNLRSLNYRIPFSDRLTVKLIAGKIVPAIATTTAAISGLACLELYKIAAKFTDIKHYRNSFLNLALGFTTFSEPIKCPVVKGLDVTIWFKIEIEAKSPKDPISECTLQEFFDIMKGKYDIEIDMVSHGTCLLYGSFMDIRRRTERLFTPISKIIENITKKKLDDNINWLLLDCACPMTDEDEGDVPPIVYKLPRSG